MTDTAYFLANASVVPVWALMVFAPRATLTERLTSTPLIPVLYGMLYITLVIAHFFIGGEGDMWTLDGLRLSFTRDLVLLLAWVHYLCFDMVVGMWALRDAKRLQLSWWMVGPCLVLMLFLGPAGFVCYVLVRRWMGGAKRWEV